MSRSSYRDLPPTSHSRFLSVSCADIETGEIDRKDMGYGHDNLRCIVLLTDRERTYPCLLRGLFRYSAYNILRVHVGQMFNGKLHDETGSVIGIKPAVTVAVILIHWIAEGRVTVIEGDAECKNAVGLPVRLFH